MDELSVRSVPDHRKNELSGKVVVIASMVLVSLLFCRRFIGTIKYDIAEIRHSVVTAKLSHDVSIQSEDTLNGISTLRPTYVEANLTVASSETLLVDANVSAVVPPSVEAPHEPSLRFQWTNMELHSGLAKRFHAHQHDCSIPIAPYKFRYSYGNIAEGESRNYGLGSELHVWSLHALYTMNLGFRIRTPIHRLHWGWWDREACKGSSSSSLLACYFPDAETSTCPAGETFHNGTVITEETELCGPHKPHPPGPIRRRVVALERTAMTEYLFSNVSPLVVQEATRQLQAVFPNGTVPSNLITIHVRWGDKQVEMELISIEYYIKATKHVVKEKHIDNVSILLCTEDPAAVHAFTSRMPKNWKVYLDQFYSNMLPYRAKELGTNDIGDTSLTVLKGKAGLWALGSMLVAMEANIFILTTASNWSRLMNELRKGIVNPRCKDCTTMVDLSYGDC